MGRIETRLDELGLTLPAPIVPPGNYQLVKIHAGLAYIAGHGPFDEPTPLVQGVVGRELTLGGSRIWSSSPSADSGSPGDVTDPYQSVSPRQEAPVREESGSGARGEAY